MQKNPTTEVDNEDENADLAAAVMTDLKAKADLLGLSYHPSIGEAKLREKIQEKLASNEASNDEGDEGKAASTKSTTTSGKKEEESAGERKARKRREASELVRVRVACMNPAKREWEGEIFTVSNAMVGTFKKYVLFNAEDGWHVPRIIYNQLVQRQCQVFVTVRDAKGNATRRGKLIREFSVEVLPPLTAVELKELAQRQALGKQGV